MLSTTTKLRVRYAETDQMGVVYHSNYLVWLEVARTDMIRAHGISYSDLERQGFGLAVAELSIRYRAPARYDDEIMVLARLTEVRSRSLRFEYDVVRLPDETLLATAATALVSVDTESGKPVALPAEILALFNGRETAE
jgi:acyl-CoA thioester hydrolase